LLKKLYSEGTVITVKVQKGQIVFNYNAPKASKKIS